MDTDTSNQHIKNVLEDSESHLEDFDNVNPMETVDAQLKEYIDETDEDEEIQGDPFESATFEVAHVYYQVK